MELKVWVEGIQRIVCGVTEKTTCQDVVYALAHATGKTGRFTLIERWRNNERLLAPQEHPLKVLQKWEEYMPDVQFILKRSALDSSKQPSTSSSAHPLSPRLHRAKYSSSAGLAHHGKSLPPFEAVWKPPPPGIPQSSSGAKPVDNNRLSPDSGRGSDKTGSDTSNSYSDKEQGGGYRKYVPSHHHQPPHHQSSADYGFSSNKSYPPAYRPPPPPSHIRNASPSDPPPYRAPPPPGVRFRPPIPTSPTTTAVVRAPHYSPPPVHRTPHLSRHPSKSSLVGGDRGGSSHIKAHHHSQTGRNPPNTSTNNGINPQHSRRATRPSHLELTDLYNLISAQQSAIQSQQNELKKFDTEVGYLEGVGLPQGGSSLPDPLSPSLDVVLSEVRRLEEVSQRNENELRHLGLENGATAPSYKEDSELREEISLLKQRLSGTDQELQKTNATLRQLGEEMRSMSIEKSKQKEHELMLEVEKLQDEIKCLQKSSEEGANISQHLSKEVHEIEEQIRERKSEVEKLIQEMRDVNMETLVISPPEESKQFLDGPPRPGSSRKILGSPRQLENAVPTSKNPHGVWV